MEYKDFTEAEKRQYEVSRLASRDGIFSAFPWIVVGWIIGEILWNVAEIILASYGW